MNNDLISREGLRNVILNDRKLDGANANWEVNRILVHIDNAPTVDYSRPPIEDIIGLMTDEELEHTTEITITTPKGKVVKFYPERPKGEWLEPYESKIAQECSICHRQMPAADWFNFCPNCGADMRGDNK